MMDIDTAEYDNFTTDINNGDVSKEWQWGITY